MIVKKPSFFNFLYLNSIFQQLLTCKQTYIYIYIYDIYAKNCWTSTFEENSYSSLWIISWYYLKIRHIFKSCNIYFKPERFRKSKLTLAKVFWYSIGLLTLVLIFIWPCALCNISHLFFTISFFPTLPM